MPNRARPAALIAFLLLAGQALAADAWTNPWAGREPVTAPVQVRPIKKWTEGDTELESFRYASHQWEGEWIWVYAVFGKPKGPGPFPGILHIHGGGQTASVPDVLDWTRRGYAVLTFDWTGQRSRGATRSPEVITHLPDGVTATRGCTPNVRYSMVYHAVLAARRGLTHLASRPEVDGSRIGSYGISWGGFTMWLVNGADDRLKAACAIYGCGIVEGRDEAWKKRIDPAWAAAYEPIHYAPRQHAPMLYLGATNDFFGRPPTFALVAERVTVPLRSAWTVNEDHHINPAAAAAYQWMEWHVKGRGSPPPEPTVRLTARDGRLVATVTAPRATQVEVLFSAGPEPSVKRLWNRRPAGKQGSEWTLALPVHDAKQPVWVIANATYPEGCYLSSRPAFATPSDLGPVRAVAPNSRVLYDPNQDGVTCTLSGGTQLYSRRMVCRIADAGPKGGKCLVVECVPPETRGFGLAFRHITDPTRRGLPTDALAIWVSGRVGPRIAVTALTHRRKPTARYVARLKLKPDVDHVW